MTINRITWARDREGRYKDRLAVKYEFEVAMEPGQWRTIASSADRPPPRNETKNKLEFLLANLKGQESIRATQLVKRLEEDQQRQDKLQAMTHRKVYAGTFSQP